MDDLAGPWGDYDDSLLDVSYATPREHRASWSGFENSSVGVSCSPSRERRASV